MEHVNYKVSHVSEANPKWCKQQDVSGDAPPLH